MCARSQAIFFLPARAGAEWIIYPKPAETVHMTLISFTAISGNPSR